MKKHHDHGETYYKGKHLDGAALQSQRFSPYHHGLWGPFIFKLSQFLSLCKIDLGSARHKVYMNSYF